MFRNNMIYLFFNICRQLGQESRSKEEALRNEIKSLQEKLKAEIKSLQAKLNDTEERLKGMFVCLRLLA